MMKALFLLLASMSAFGQLQRPNGISAGRVSQPTGSQAVSQQTSASQPPYIGPKGSISGTVLDSVSGAPVKKAQVHGGGGAPVAVTDASGSFTFDQLPPGSYVIGAQHPTYPQNGAMMQAPLQVTLGPGEQKRGQDIKLVPGSSVSGHVTDDDGDPLANCSVSLLRRMGTNMQPLQNVMTNAAGEYSVPNTSAGKYLLQARCMSPYLQPRPYAPPNAVLAGPQYGYAPRFYPGTTNLESAQKVKLSPGQEMRGVDFRMALQKVTTITLHVSGLDEERRNRLFASLVTTNDSTLPGNFSNLSGMVQPRTGLAQIRSVPPGTYTLVLTSAGPERAVLARQPVQVGEEPLEVAVQIAPMLPISGTVHMDNATPASDPQNSSKPAVQHLFLTPSDGETMQISTTVAADGSFTFRSLSAGHYRANVSTGGNVQSVSVGGATTEGPEFELKQGATGPLTINVGSATGTLSGEVQIGDSHPAQILVFASTSQGANSSMVNVGASSGQPLRYSIPLPPGTYRVYALEVNNPATAFQFTTSEALNGREEKVEIRAGAEASRNLKLVTAADFEKADQ